MVLKAHKIAVTLSAVAAAFLALTVIDVAFVNRVSPWHDEIWNLYPAFSFLGVKTWIWPGCEQQMCVKLLGLRIPVLSGPYHGVIKTALFSPAVLLGEIGLVRLLNVALYLVPLAYIGLQKKEFGTRGVIFLSVGYALLFPGLIFEAAFDQGQFIVAGVLLTIAAVELAKDMEEHSARRVVIAALCCALAVYEKLTTIPAAAALSSVAAFRLIQRQQWAALMVAASSLLLFLPYVRYAASNYETISGMTSVDRLPYWYGFNITLKTIHQSLFTKVYTATQIIGHDIKMRGAALATSLVFITWFIALLNMKRHDVYAQLILLLSPVIAIAIYPLLGGLYRPWHVYQMAPLAMGPIALIALRARGSSLRTSGLAVLSVAIALVGVVNAAAIAKGVVNRERAHPFDGSLFPIVSAIKDDRRAKAIVCLDYSVCYQTAFMLGPDFRLQAEFAFSPISDICWLVEGQKKPFYAIAHPSSRDFNAISSNTIDELSHGRSDRFFLECSKGYEEVYSAGNVGSSGYRVLLFK